MIAFIEQLRLTAGDDAGKPFKLRPWQKRIIRGIYKPGVKTAVISLPRGQGKTQLTAAVTLAHLVGPESRPRAELYSAANDHHQAARIWREALAMLELDPELHGRVIEGKQFKTLEDEVTGSVYQALAAKAKKGYSLAPSLVIYDELGGAQGRELYDSLNTALAKVPGSLLIVISTQADRDDHIMSELVDHGIQVNEGTVDDPTFHLTLYSAPEDADIFDPKVWKACNPALGDFLDLSRFKQQAKQAERSPSAEPAFRNLLLNQRVATHDTFISRDAWLACGDTAEPGGPCWCGLDTATVQDLAALVAYWPETGAVQCWFWTPADTVLDHEHSDRVPYSVWVRNDLLLTTPGKTIDLEAPLLKLGELIGQYDVHGVAHDRWRVGELRKLAENLGLDVPLIEFGQGFKDLAPAIDATERAILEGAISHGGHPVLTWNVSNAIVVSDPAGNRKVDKSRSTGRIDGLVALIMAVGLHAREPGPITLDFTDGITILSA